MIYDFLQNLNKNYDKNANKKDIQQTKTSENDIVNNINDYFKTPMYIITTRSN